MNSAIAENVRRSYSRYLIVGGIIAATVAVIVVFAELRPPASNAKAVTAVVDSCELNVAGAARVTYSVTNGDVEDHGYKVETLIKHGATVLGTGNSLVNHVAAGKTETGQVLVPYQGGPAGATCAVSASVYEGPIGRH